ncbi:MAG TPA: tyrosine-type recombinase/integrase [Spirochaetota bacterium]|nr:tyrosine-type recombinase/integrase [Spirochaetota bacterium]
MKPEHEKIMNEYLREIALQGRPTMKRASVLNIFFRYLEDAGFDLFRLTVAEAQELQTRFATATREDGTIRYSRSSVGNIIVSATSLFEYLRKKRYLPSNPFREITRLRREKPLPKNILSEEKMDAFLRHLKEFWKGKDLIERRGRYKAHVIAELMYSTGMRINEAASLTAQDVDLLRGTVRVSDPKTRTKRDTILNEYASKVLRLYIDTMRSYVLFGKNGADDTCLFGARYNLQMWLNALLNEAGRELGLPKVTSHHFRHAVGYHLLRGGCDIRYIQEILGHKALGSTQIYTKVDKEDLKSVIDTYHPRRLYHEKP